MVWDVFGVAGFVLASATVWMVAATLRQLGVRDPAALPPVMRRILLVPHLPDGTVAAFAGDRKGATRVAFISNPTKAGLLQVREAAYRACSIRYLPEPVWLYTTATDPGREAAREAIAAGADELIAVGGDGTVRAVAEVAAEAGVPLGIIPMGTGNLLARNLDLPLNDTGAALRAALDGQETSVDIGWLTITDDEGSPSRHPFLVFAGVGIDADMVAKAGEGLKRQLGWIAYLIAAVPFMTEKRMRATLTVDGSEPLTSKMRSVVFANAGRLPGGFALVPDAKVNDGMLDFATIDARAGIAGWAELFGEAWVKGAGINAPTLPSNWRAGRIDHTRGTHMRIETELPQRVQADGESLGRARVVDASIEPQALRLRVPSTHANTEAE